MEEVSKIICCFCLEFSSDFAHEKKTFMQALFFSNSSNIRPSHQFSLQSVRGCMIEHDCQSLAESLGWLTTGLKSMLVAPSSVRSNLVLQYQFQNRVINQLNHFCFESLNQQFKKI